MQITKLPLINSTNGNYYSYKNNKRENNNFLWHKIDTFCSVIFGKYPNVKNLGKTFATVVTALSLSFLPAKAKAAGKLYPFLNSDVIVTTNTTKTLPELFKSAENIMFPFQSTNYLDKVIKDIQSTMHTNTIQMVEKTICSECKVFIDDFYFNVYIFKKNL